MASGTPHLEADTVSARSHTPRKPPLVRRACLLLAAISLLAGPAFGQAVTYETWLTGVFNPTALAWAPDGRLFLTELQTGSIRIVEDGTLVPGAFATVDPEIGPEEVVVEGEADEAGQPLYEWNPVVTPTGLTFYDGNVYPELSGDLIVGTFNDPESLWRFRLGGPDLTIVEEAERLFENVTESFVLDVVQGPDG